MRWKTPPLRTVDGKAQPCRPRPVDRPLPSVRFGALPPSPTRTACAGDGVFGGCLRQHLIRHYGRYVVVGAAAAASAATEPYVYAPVGDEANSRQQIKKQRRPMAAPTVATVLQSCRSCRIFHFVINFYVFIEINLKILQFLQPNANEALKQGVFAVAKRLQKCCKVANQSISISVP